jgi:hypothetical protein
MSTACRCLLAATIDSESGGGQVGFFNPKLSNKFDTCPGHKWGDYPKPYPIFDTVIWQKVKRCKVCGSVDVKKWKKR